MRVVVAGAELVGVVVAGAELVEVVAGAELVGVVKASGRRGSNSSQS